MTLTILLHSSKTMVPTTSKHPVSTPQFLHEAEQLAGIVRGLTPDELARVMHISNALAEDVTELFAAWKAEPSEYPAIETFRGDIYSGLRARDFNESEATFAQKHLVLLSGMYGLLRPYDGIWPYRLEAAYKLPIGDHSSVYKFWGDRLAREIPAEGPIVNVTSAEYEKLLLPYIEKNRLITPKFLSRMPGKEQPVFVAVHAKIARGAFARWLIKRGKDSADGLETFNDLGYVYHSELSTPHQPVYVCDSFQGIGLSQRLA